MRVERISISLGNRALDPRARAWGEAGSRTPKKRVTAASASEATSPWSEMWESNSP